MYQDGEEQETLYRSELADYEEQIQKAILKERHVEEEPRGLMHYFDGNRQVAAKVISAFPKVQNIRGELFGVLECSICQPLTQNEIYELKNYWDGQMSDGWEKALNKDQSIAGGRTVCQFLDTGKTLGRHDGGRTGQNLEPWHDADPVKK